MVHFPLLRTPYRPCASDLLVDVAARRYWFELFDGHFDVHLRAAERAGVPAARTAAARAAFTAEIAALRERPDEHGRLDVLVLCERRQGVLDAHGIRDEFAADKARENDAALAVFPGWLARLDGLGPEAAVGEIVRGMLAGNLFDLGVRSTAARFAGTGIPFDEALAAVPARPWHRDDLDDLAPVLATRRGGRAVIFADNAGGDAVLGVLPLARFLVMRGGSVVLAANDTPALNDVTAAELRDVRDRAASVDAVFGSAAIEVVGSGSRQPLIDLSRVSAELAAAARDADLVVLVGMGRGIESNWDARFTVPVLRVAMLKDEQVARDANGRPFDAVCRFDPADAGS